MDNNNNINNNNQEENANKDKDIESNRNQTCITSISSPNTTLQSKFISNQQIQNNQDTSNNSNFITNNNNVSVNISDAQNLSSQLSPSISNIPYSSHSYGGPKYILSSDDIEKRKIDAEKRISKHKNTELIKRNTLNNEELAKNNLVTLHILENENENIKLKLKSDIEIARFEYLEKKRNVQIMKDNDNKINSLKILEDIQKAKSRSKEIPLHERISKQFEEQTLKEELENRKAALLSIKTSRAALSKQELDEHERYYRNQHIEMLNSTKPIRNDHPNFSITKVRLEEERRIAEERQKELDIKEHAMRSRHYANLVREMYPPVVDPIKQREIENRLRKSQPRKLLEYKDPYHGHPPPLPEGYSPVIIKQRPESPKPIRKIDYLQEIKHKREIENMHSPTKETSEQRIEKLKSHIILSESHLNETEAKIQYNDNHLIENNDNDIIDISNMYCNVIKMKLSLLNELSRNLIS